MTTHHFKFPHSYRWPTNTRWYIDICCLKYLEVTTRRIIKSSEHTKTPDCTASELWNGWQKCQQIRFTDQILPFTSFYFSGAECFINIYKYWKDKFWRNTNQTNRTLFDPWSLPVNKQFQNTRNLKKKIKLTPPKYELIFHCSWN